MINVYILNRKLIDLMENDFGCFEFYISKLIFNIIITHLNN